MNKIVVCLRDTKAENWLVPIVVNNRAVAIRSFEDAVKDSRKDTDIAKHPEDFVLFEIGSWSATDSVNPFTRNDAPVALACGVDFVG